MVAPASQRWQACRNERSAVYRPNMPMEAFFVQLPLIYPNCVLTIISISPCTSVQTTNSRVLRTPAVRTFASCLLFIHGPLPHASLNQECGKNEFGGGALHCI